MKIAVAMSGGVDSSVAAKILKDRGHDLIGLFLKLWSDPTSLEELRGAGPTSEELRGAGPSSSSGGAGSTCRRENRCCDYEALEDARMVAAKLKIPFYVVDAKKEFKREVVDYFLREYQNLRTPNPCIVCNETIKFNLLLKKALSIGCDRLATGHYARIKCHLRVGGDPLIVDSRLHGNDELCRLFKGVDETKDQSYMLYRLNQNQLSKVLFPLGDMTKKEVRGLAVKWDLPVKEKPESQEICFFADRDYRVFLKRYLDPKFFAPGNIVDIKGNVIGKHVGLLNYTIGQRRLINQRSKIKDQNNKSKTDKDKNPLYVIGFNRKNNQLIVGGDREVYKSEMIVGNLNWIRSIRHSELDSGSISVKIRYRHPEVECDISSELSSSGLTRGSQNRSVDSRLRGNDTIRVLFKKPQRAITPGQSAVFYIGDEVVGGGIIES